MAGYQICNYLVTDPISLDYRAGKSISDMEKMSKTHI